MTDRRIVDTLNELFRIVHRSLPQYLAEASPWKHRGEAKAAAALENIVADQQRDARRLADAILDREGLIEPGNVPMDFTDLNFLSLDYLLREMVEHQKRDVARMERLVPRLAGDPEAHGLAQEVLGSERAHLESLEELTGDLAGNAA